MSLRYGRIIGERRGWKRTIKLGSETTSIYLDDAAWERLQQLRVKLGKSTREIVTLARMSPGDSLSDQVRAFLTQKADQ